MLNHRRSSRQTPSSDRLQKPTPQMTIHLLPCLSIPQPSYSPRLPIPTRAYTHHGPIHHRPQRPHRPGSSARRVGSRWRCNAQRRSEHRDCLRACDQHYSLERSSIDLDCCDQHYSLERTSIDLDCCDQHYSLKRSSLNLDFQADQHWVYHIVVYYIVVDFAHSNWPATASQQPQHTA